MTYTLGLDLGIGSVGAAGVRTQQQEIVFALCHVFDKAEEPDGKSLAANRREKRLARRVHSRRVIRKGEVRACLKEYGLPIEALEQSTVEGVTSPWALRKAGLKRLLTPEEWARTLYHINNHRGYDSPHARNKNTEELTTGQFLWLF